MGKHTVNIVGEQAQELVFHGSQVQLVAVETDGSCRVVDAQAAVLEERLLACGIVRHISQVALGGAQAREQLADREGLGEVVVSPGVERLDLVGVVGARGQNDDRHRRPGAYALDDLDAVEVG